MGNAQEKFENDFAELYKAASGNQLKKKPEASSLSRKTPKTSVLSAKERIQATQKTSKKNKKTKDKVSQFPVKQDEKKKTEPPIDDIPDIDDDVQKNERRQESVGTQKETGENNKPDSNPFNNKKKSSERVGKAVESQKHDNSNLSEEELSRQPIPLFDIPENIAPYIEIEDCSKFVIERYYVTKAHLEIRDAVVKNQQMVREFRAIGLNYLNSTILYGVPGTGKTVMCRWLSYNLHIPFCYINFAKMIDGVFGNTARNITEVFRFLQDKNCIFLIDEIDCVATKRGSETAATGGELSRITITIMQELDRYRRDGAQCILFAATNRVDMLDAALLSRFSIMHEMKPLNVREKDEYIRQFLDDLKIPYDPANIKDYATTNIQLRQRNVEADIIRCIAEWIDYNKIQGIDKPYYLNHHDSD